MTGELYYAVFRTAAGWAGVMGSADGLRRLALPRPSRVEALAGLGITPPAAEASPERFTALAARLQSYFAGQPVDFPDALDLAGATPFQRRVWAAAQRIPYGETRSYGWLAAALGKPQAARAVGGALGRNPLPVIIPCHRVLAGDGALGGFSGGLDMKRLLLGLEGAG